MFKISNGKNVLRERYPHIGCLRMHNIANVRTSVLPSLLIINIKVNLQIITVIEENINYGIVYIFFF